MAVAMTSFGRLVVANDLVDALIADANELCDSSSGQAGGRRGAYRVVALGLGVGISPCGAFEAFFGGHKMQSRKLDKQTQGCLEY